MASFDLPETPKPRVSPALLVGVASPLWPYFGAMAASGMAYWWMTRWTRPVNLEAVLGETLKLPAPILSLEPVTTSLESAVEAAVVAQADVVDAVFEAAPAADEAIETGAAPDMAPPTMADPDPVAEPEPETVFAVAPEPVIDEPAPVWTEPTALDVAPRPRARRTALPAPDTEA